MDSKFNNTTTIKRYVRDEMDKAERLEFEAAVEMDKDLKLEVLLARQRRAAIENRMKAAALHTDVTDIPGPASGGRAIGFSVLAGLTIVAVIWFSWPPQPSEVKPPDIAERPDPAQQSVPAQPPVPTVAKPEEEQPAHGSLPAESRYKDHPQLARDKHKPDPVSLGTLSGSKRKLAPVVQAANTAYLAQDSSALSKILQTDTSVTYRPHLLTLAAHLAMQQGDYKRATTYWETLRQIPDFQNMNEYDLALCYAARFSKMHKKLKLLSVQSSDPEVKTLYQQCLSKH